MHAKKKLDIWSLPDILIIHLKRFSPFRKLNTFVDFPLTGLDMSKFLKSEGSAQGCSNVYDLFAVSQHMGAMGGGHYTAAVKNLQSKKWLVMDDSIATPVQPKSIVNSSAYVLFYSRRI